MPHRFPLSIGLGIVSALALFSLSANALYTWVEPDGQQHISTVPARCITPERTTRIDCFVPAEPLQGSNPRTRMYQWVDPQSGTPYLSSNPPSWYRTPQTGPRVLVFENGRIVDDTAEQVGSGTARGLRDEAARSREARERRERLRRAQDEQDRIERQIQLKQENRSKRFAQVAQQAKKSGTAWVVAPGYVVTSHHVINDARDIRLFLSDGEELQAQPVVVDSVNDLAILSVVSPERLPPAIPVSTDPVSLGTEVSTIGFPIIPLLGVKPKMTSGIVSSTAGPRDEAGIYQISVPVQKGNSGGPLLNMNGEAIAVTAFKLDAKVIFKWTNDLPENVNYAMKASHLVPLLASLPIPARPVGELSREQGTLAELAARIRRSVLIVLVS